MHAKIIERKRLCTSVKVVDWPQAWLLPPPPFDVVLALCMLYQPTVMNLCEYPRYQCVMADGQFMAGPWIVLVHDEVSTWRLGCTFATCLSQ